MSKAVIGALAERFPQLYLKPEQGVSQSELYRAIVRKGQRFVGTLEHFIGSAEDSITVEHTPAGDVTVIFLRHRADFECLYQIMACRCEPTAVPATMGACYLSGVNDWSCIHAHMEAYRAAGGQDTAAEFSRFTANPANYRQTMIFLSEGPYSAVPAEKTPYTEEKWLRLSRRIRAHHELTHFICRKQFPEKKHPLWDEILADCMGLLFATGGYDLALAQAFLGIGGGAYCGGRLQNYLETPVDADTVRWVGGVMNSIAHLWQNHPKGEGAAYRFLQLLEENAETFWNNSFDTVAILEL